MSTVRARWIPIAAALVAFTLVASCTSSDDGSDADSTSTTAPAGSAAEQGEVLVGEVDGGKGLVAIVHTSDAVTVYACGFDEALDTHTGWFNGVPTADGDDRVIPAITNPGGLTVEGTITGDDASGTLTLASGDKVDWSAHKTGGEGAGLYADEDALALAGLIVAEDGRMVGSASLRFSPVGTGGTSTPPTTLASPSATTTTHATTTTTPATTTTSGATTTTRPPGTTAPPKPITLPIVVPTKPPTGDPVIVTIPIPDKPRPTRLPPVTKPRTVTKDGPAIVFLVHGMSENATTPGADEEFDSVECSGPRNTPFSGRCEFGPDFIPGLYGSDVGAQLSNLAGQDMTGNRFITSVEGDDGIDDELGMAVDANGCAVDPTVKEELDPAIASHFIAPAQDARLASLPVPVPPRLSVFTTWRDSTTGIVASGRRLERQAYAASRWWEDTYHQTPQIIFVAQSFGGLATRFVLDNPTDASISPLNPDKVTVCPEDHARMDYLRNRTAYAVTLATPHEGSFLAEVGEGAKDKLRAVLADLDAGVDSQEVTQVVTAVEDAAAFFDIDVPDVRAQAHDGVDDLLALLNSPALRDMKLANMVRWNTGPLAPDRARRTAASPMVGAAGELIPLYASLARTPGSSSFDTPDLEDAFATYATERPKEQSWIFMTSIASEALVTQLSPVRWGSITGALVPYTDILDRRARLFDLSTDTDQAEQYLEDAAEQMLGAPASYFRGTYGDGVDGVLEYFADINVEVFLPNALIPIYVEHLWTMDLSGSVDVPMIAFECGGNQIILDYDPLITALLAGFDDTSAALDAIGSGDLEALLDAAQLAQEDGNALVEDTIAWFQEKETALGNAVGEDCDLPTDPVELVTDFFSLGNITNWHVTEVMGPVPAPQWVETDELAHDGEQDTDGAVHAASALGLQLGREPFFFEHDKGGSWYRIPDEPITEQYNHGLQYQNDVGQWIHDRFFVAGVGPVPQVDGDSAWPG